MKLMRLLCMVVFINIWIPAHAQGQEALVRIYATLSNGRSQGSGFFISNHGQILTAYHVVMGASAIEVRSERLGKAFTNIEVESVSPEYDLAVLKALNSGVTPFIRLMDYAPHTQDDLQIEGYPLGDPFQIIRGYPTRAGLVQTKAYNNMRGERLFALNIQVIPLGAIIYSGMSGGPVLYRNQAIGVLSGSYVQGGSIGWAIPVKYLKSSYLHAVNLKPDRIQIWKPLRLMDESRWKTLRSMVTMNPKAAALTDDLSNSVEALANTYQELYAQSVQTRQDLEAYQPIVARMANDPSLSASDWKRVGAPLVDTIRKFSALCDQAGRQGQEISQEEIGLLTWVGDRSNIDGKTRKAFVKRMRAIVDEHRDMRHGIDAYLKTDRQALIQAGTNLVMAKRRTPAEQARAFSTYLNTIQPYVNAFASPRALFFMSAVTSMQRQIIELMEPVVYKMNVSH